MNEPSREDFLEPSPSSNGTLIMLSLASLEPMVLFPIVDPALAVDQPESWVSILFAASEHSVSATVSCSYACFFTQILDLIFRPGIFHFVTFNSK